MRIILSLEQHLLCLDIKFQNFIYFVSHNFFVFLSYIRRILFTWTLENGWDYILFTCHWTINILSKRYICESIDFNMNLKKKKYFFFLFMPWKNPKLKINKRLLLLALFLLRVFFFIPSFHQCCVKQCAWHQHFLALFAFYLSRLFFVILRYWVSDQCNWIWRGKKTKEKK